MKRTLTNAANESAGLAPGAETAKLHTSGDDYRLDLIIWQWAYRLEELREAHASTRNLWRQAVCCVGLAVLRVFGGR